MGQEVHIEISQEVSKWRNKTANVPELGLTWTPDQTTNESRNILRKLGFLVFNMAVGQEVHIEISQEVSTSSMKDLTEEKIVKGH